MNKYKALNVYLTWTTKWAYQMETKQTKQPLTYDDIIGYDFQSPDYRIVEVRILHDKVTGQDFICKSRTTQIHSFKGRSWTFLKGFRDVYKTNQGYECSEFIYSKSLQ